MNKDNLYDNTLEELVEYYGNCCVAFESTSDIVWDGDDIYVQHVPSEVLEVILDKFSPTVR